MNYIRKHWRGELSLVTAFWVNVFLINIATRLLNIGLTNYQVSENPVTASQITLIYSVLLLAIIYPWQIVGMWRTCDNHIAEYGRRFVARGVQVLIVVGIVATFAYTKTSWPIYKALFQIAFQKDPYGDYKLRVVKDGTLLRITGPLSFGISEEAKQLLQEHPGVEGVILDSPGGRVYEGRELSKLVTHHELDTYTFKGCYSMCTIVFVSGTNRFLGIGANLGFHQYASTFDGISAFADLKGEQAKDLQLFRQQGIESEFLTKLFDTPHDDIWYPTVDALLAAGVIHDVFNPSELLPINYGDAAPEFQEVSDSLLAVPLFKTIKRYEPEIYRKILATMKKKFEQGAGQLEMQDAASSHLYELTVRLLPKGSDGALINYIRQFIKVSKILVLKDPILCVKYLNPEQYGVVQFSRYLSREEMMPTLDAMKRIIIDAYEKENPTVDTLAAEDLMEKVVALLGEDVEYLDPPGLQNRDQYERHCEAVISFYEFILREKANSAANALRYAFSPS